MKYLILMLAVGLSLSLNALAADKKTVCDEKVDPKASWVVGESWGNSYVMTWFRIDATKSVLCLAEVANNQEKMLFKNTYLTSGNVKFTAGNCSFEGGPDQYVLAEVVDDGAPSATAYKAWRFDDRTKRLRYVDAGKVECSLQ